MFKIVIKNSSTFEEHGFLQNGHRVTGACNDADFVIRAIQGLHTE